jgi:hypothetical protein
MHLFLSVHMMLGLYIQRHTSPLMFISSSPCRSSQKKLYYQIETGRYANVVAFAYLLKEWCKALRMKGIRIKEFTQVTGYSQFVHDRHMRHPANCSLKGKCCKALSFLFRRVMKSLNISYGRTPRNMTTWCLMHPLCVPKHTDIVRSSVLYWLYCTEEPSHTVVLHES